jgi:hypothetical protein
MYRLSLIALSSNRLNSFRAINELGYVCCNAPLLATTSSRVYGHLMRMYLGVSYHSFTAYTCASNSASSASPCFASVERSSYKSAGRAEDTEGFTGWREELDMRVAILVQCVGVIAVIGYLIDRYCRVSTYSTKSRS